MSQDKTNAEEVLETDEAATEEEAVDQENSSDNPEVNRLYARLKKEQEKRKELEQEAEALRKQKETLNETLNPKEDKVEQKQPDSLSREEAILYAKGYSDEDVERLKKIAGIEELDLLEAEKSDMFTAWKEKQKAEAQNQSAQLGASSGSAPHREETFTAGMSKDAHKELWKKAMGQ